MTKSCLDHRRSQYDWRFQRLLKGYKLTLSDPPAQNWLYHSRPRRSLHPNALELQQQPAHDFQPNYQLPIVTVTSIKL
ncbi:hypothetical protein ACTXT7_006440 [Hymenolepis weldensis]